MDRKSIIQAARGQEEEKVGFSLKLPKGLKDRLQEVSEKENVSMNALIVATLQAMLDDECGKQLRLAKNLLLEYRKTLEPKVTQYTMNPPVGNQDEYEWDKIETTWYQINNLLGV